MTFRKTAAIASLLTVLMMTVLDVTVVNVALPVMAEEFAVSDSAAVWVVTSYQLVLTMLLLPLSSLGDIYGYRRVFLAGVALFTGASALCAAAHGFATLVAARALQGLGGACVMGVNIALTRIIYSPSRLGRGLALNAMVIAVATAAGPTVAGLILSGASWHWLFIVNIPLGIVGFLLGRGNLPDNPGGGASTPFDTVSAILNAVVFGSLFFALGNFSRGGNATPSVALLAVSAILGTVYVRRQHGRTAPLLPVDLFSDRVYTLSIVTSMCSFIAQTATCIALPFMLMNSLGYDSMTVGLLLTPWPIATMAISPAVARLAERRSPAVLAAMGMAFFIAGLLSLLTVDAGTSVWGAAWRMALCGVGYGFFQTPNNIVMVRSSPISRAGGVSGMQSTARLCGQTLGATAVTILFSVFAGTTAATRACLILSTLFALAAAILSLTRRR